MESFLGKGILTLYKIDKEIISVHRFSMKVRWSVIIISYWLYAEILQPIYFLMICEFLVFPEILRSSWMSAAKSRCLMSSLLWRVSDWCSRFFVQFLRVVGYLQYLLENLLIVIRRIKCLVHLGQTTDGDGYIIKINAYFRAFCFPVYGNNAYWMRFSFRWRNLMYLVVDIIKMWQHLYF